MLNDPDDAGFWAVTRHADIVTVSRTNEVFLSGKGVMFENFPPELLETTQSFVAMDPPRHAKLRKLATAAFTPRQIRRIEDAIKASAQAIVGELKAAGSGSDFVECCAKELPLRTLAHMVGIPESEREAVAYAADGLVSANDPVFLDGREPLAVMGENIMHLHQLAGSLAATRRERPGDDLFSSLVNAEVDGDRLTDAEVAAYFVLLCVAGNDTTRQTTSHAIKALSDFPAQRAWLLEDFDRPDSLDLSRDPNPHVGFGGGGQHYCLGTHVACAQLRAIFGELLRELRDIEAGDLEYLAGSFIHGIRAMPCTFGPN